MTGDDWRAPSARERALLDRLLSGAFSGKETILRQLSNPRVRVIDDRGSLALEVSSPERAMVKHRIPIEAEVEDRDGVTVHMLLHVVDGVATELELYKDDSSALLELPPADQWRLIELHT